MFLGEVGWQNFSDGGEMSLGPEGWWADFMSSDSSGIFGLEQEISLY